MRNAALRQWRVGVGTLEITTAFLNADTVTPNEEVIVVKLPAVFRMIGIKKNGEYIRIFTALMCFQDRGVLVEIRFFDK